MTQEEMQLTLDAMGEKALSAARALAVLEPGVKTAFLLRMADLIEAEAASVIEANAADLEYGREKGLSDAMLDRLNEQSAIPQTSPPRPLQNIFDQRRNRRDLPILLADERDPAPDLDEISEAAFWPLDALPVPMSDFTERRIRDALAGGPVVIGRVEGRTWRE
jgi:hypothetical protein